MFKNSTVIVIFFGTLGVAVAANHTTYEFMIDTDHAFLRHVEQIALNYTNCNCTKTSGERCYEIIVLADGGPGCIASDYLRAYNLTVPKGQYLHIKEPEPEPQKQNIAVILSSAVGGSALLGTAGYFGFQFVKTIMQRATYVVDNP